MKTHSTSRCRYTYDFFQRAHYVEMTSMRRHHVESMSVQHQLDIMCLLGLYKLAKNQSMALPVRTRNVILNAIFHLLATMPFLCRQDVHSNRYPSRHVLAQLRFVHVDATSSHRFNVHATPLRRHVPAWTGAILDDQKTIARTMACHRGKKRFIKIA